MGYIELELRDDNSDPDFRGISHFCMDKDQIAFFLPLKDKNGGCRLVLKGGGTINVKETYEQIRWFLDSKTILERAKDYVIRYDEEIENKRTPFTADQDIGVREAARIFGDKIPVPNSHVFEKVAQILNDIMPDNGQYQVDIESVRYHFNDISAFANGSEIDFDLPPQMSAHDVEELRARLKVEIDKKTSGAWRSGRHPGHSLD